MTALAKGANTPLLIGRFRVRLQWAATRASPDLDLCALLTEGRRVRSDADFVFYNQPTAQGVAHSRPVGAGADELSVDIAQLEPTIDAVVVAASADGGTFGQVAGLRLTVHDADSGATLVTFDVTDATTETAFVLGEIYLRHPTWKFRAVGQGYANGLAGLASDFGVTVGGPQPAPTLPPAAPAALPAPPPWGPAPMDWLNPPVPAGYELP